MGDLITQYLVQGDLIGFILAIYTRPMGQIFYGLLMLIPSFTIYMKTQNLTYVYILWAGLSSVMLTMLPLAAFSVAHVFLALGAMGLLMKLVITLR